MPIIWRYLTRQFLKVFFFSVVAFIAVLLTLRLEEIAGFVCIDTTREYILWFILYQIPYILPIAIPISCLISSWILVQSLSTSHELVALRASGYSLTKIFLPILTAAAFIAFANFYMLSEVATNSHLKTSLLKCELRAVNPLILLQNRHLQRSKGLYYDTLGPSKMGEIAADVVLGIPSKHGMRMNLLLAKHLMAHDNEFLTNRLTFITSLKTKDAKAPYGPIAIENVERSRSSIEGFADIIQKKVWTLNNDHLGWKSLMIKTSQERPGKQLTRVYTEFTRRLSLGLAPLTFTLLGLSFGLTISRHRSVKNLVFAMVLTSFFLITFFVAKGMDDRLEASLALYFIPHLILAGASLLNLRRLSQGIE